MHRLSYRFKVPLQVVLVVLVTTITIATAVAVHAWRDAEREQIAHGQGLARVLSESVAPLMLREDLWRAWEVVRAPVEAATDTDRGGRHPVEVILIDADGTIFVSDDPERTPTGTSLEAYVPDMARQLAERPVLQWRGRFNGPEGVWILQPVQQDQQPLGAVALRYDTPGVFARLEQSVPPIAVAASITLVLLLPLGWYLGRRIARPLSELSRYAEAVGRELPRKLADSIPRPEGRDEVARLQARFGMMLDDLARKDELEREMVRSERLAAIGQLSAGVAHEINNPLGGMLNALDTYRRHGPSDAFTEQTFSMLERGLRQIQNIVRALLVEGRVTHENLSDRDLSDIETLVAHDLKRTGAVLRWVARPETMEEVAVPATPVRQILMNLILNGARAAGEHGEVRVAVRRDDDAVCIDVSNDGPGIPEARLQRIFEPFVGDATDGTGLGLWVTYQLVVQMGGSIDAESDGGETRFHVRLPLEFQESEAS